MTHYITQDGLNVMLRGLLGDKIEFTKIKFGNGTPGDGAADLVNPLLELGITTKKREGSYITLGCMFTNTELDVDAFWATEIAVYVKDPTDATKEICYGIWEETRRTISVSPKSGSLNRNIPYTFMSRPPRTSLL